MNNNKNHEQEAIDLCMYWEKGFNERNREICIEAMHFPHVRLWVEANTDQPKLDLS